MVYLGVSLLYAFWTGAKDLNVNIKKIPIVAVIGGGSISDDATRAISKEVGIQLAESGVHLLTGGGQGVMNFVSESFVSHYPRFGNSIGVIPGTTTNIDSKIGPMVLNTKSNYPNAFVEIPVMTHLPGDDPYAMTSRNHINILSADLVIALTGGAGTAAELELAQRYGKPVIVYLKDNQRIAEKNLNEVGGENPSSNTARVSTFRDFAKELFDILINFTHPRPAFGVLKENYHTDAGSVHRCSMSFPNTCAIRLSEALVRTDSNFLDFFKTSPHNKCPHDYLRGAQDLASVLRVGSVFGRHDRGWDNPGAAPTDIMGKTGIVCYMNIPSYPDGQGHIDLWNKTGPVGDAYWTGSPIWFWELR